MAADAADILLSKSGLSKPAVHTEGRPHLRVLGTEITLLDGIRERAEADLGITIGYETLDFLGAQQKAATQPGAFDIYDQCFHNLDIVWFWKAIQPIDTGRIPHWGEVNDLTKTGRLSADAMIGRGDAPVKKLYVQPDRSLGPQPSRQISMLPAVHNVDAFAYDPTVVPPGQPYETESWGWLLDERWHGRVALVDEPAIGVFDAALAAQARGEASFADIGNMTLAEIDRLIDLLIARKRQGHFCGFWQTMADAKRLMVDHRAAIQSSWAPAAVALSGLRRAGARGGAARGLSRLAWRPVHRRAAVRPGAGRRLCLSELVAVRLARRGDGPAGLLHVDPEAGAPVPGPGGMGLLVRGQAGGQGSGRHRRPGGGEGRRGALRRLLLAPRQPHRRVEHGDGRAQLPRPPLVGADGGVRLRARLCSGAAGPLTLPAAIPANGPLPLP